MKQKEVTNNVNWNANATEYIVNVHTFWATRLNDYRHVAPLEQGNFFRVNLCNSRFR